MKDDNKPKGVEIKVYGAPKFFLEEGYYTLQELENIVAYVKETKVQLGNHLAKSMGLTK